MASSSEPPPEFQNVTLFASGGRPLSVPPVRWVRSILQTLRMAPAAETYAKVDTATIEENKEFATDEELLQACFTLGGLNPTVTRKTDIESQSGESTFFELYWKAPNVKRFAKLCLCVGDKKNLRASVENRQSGLKKAGSDKYREGPFVKFDAYDIKIKYGTFPQFQGIVILMEFVEPPDHHDVPSRRRDWGFVRDWQIFVRGARNTIGKGGDGKGGDNYYDMNPRHIGMKVRTSSEDPFEFRHLAPDRLNDKMHFPEFPLWRKEELRDMTGNRKQGECSQLFEKSAEFVKYLKDTKPTGWNTYKYGQMDYACEITCQLTDKGATTDWESRRTNAGPTQLREYANDFYRSVPHVKVPTAGGLYPNLRRKPAPYWVGGTTPDLR